MHRLLVLAAAALVGLAALGAGPAALDANPAADARQATPVTDAAGVVFDDVEPEVLASGAVPAYPPEPAELVLLHLRFAPGGRVLIPAADPGLDLVYVEAGAVTVRVTVPVVARRGAAPGTQEVPADTEFALGAGDSFVAPAASGGEMRNDGAGEARVLIAYVAPASPATPTP